MTLAQQEEAELLELTLKRRKLRGSLTEWSRFCGYEPAAHHKVIIAKLEAVARGDIKRLALFLPPGSAKALALDTPIPTPNGWTTIGELKVGDLVFDEQGFTCRVTGKSDIFRGRELFKIKTDCGDEIVADAEHEWPIRLDYKYPVVKNKTSKWLFERQMRQCNKRPMINRAYSLMTLPQITLVLDPYVLGCWLGDGHTVDPRITIGVQDYESFVKEFTKLGFPVNEGQRSGCSYSFIGLRDKLCQLGLLGNKHIPREYFRASYDQRKALLQGLIDTDGSVNDSGEVCFTSTLRSLAEGVAELVRTLGAKASINETRATLYGKDCGPCWRVHFYLEGCARLPRKSCKTKNNKRTPNTYIDVEFHGFGDSVCISVNSPSHLFLCGKSMTPTHNSTYSSILFPVWFLAQRDRASILACSHTAELALKFGRQCRNLVEEHGKTMGYTLASDSQAADDWATTDKSVYFCAGVKGRIPGRRADLGLIDDPIGSIKEADSLSYREDVWEWYKWSFFPRLTPNASVVVISTRWHEDDLMGRLQRLQPGKWEVIKFPMEATEDGDILGRTKGERLWPEYFTPEMVDEAKADPRLWQGAYQQDPSPEKGMYFDADWLIGYEPMNVPKALTIYVASDHACSTKDIQKNDPNLFVPFGVDEGDNIWIFPDVWWEHGNTGLAVEEMIKIIKRRDPTVWVAETEHIVKSIGPFLRTRMREESLYRTRLQELPGGRDKASKARSIQGRLENRKVFFPTFAPWWPKARHELLTFPVGVHDEWPDVLGVIGRYLERLQPGHEEKKAKELEEYTYGWLMKEHRKTEDERDTLRRGF